MSICAFSLTFLVGIPLGVRDLKTAGPIGGFNDEVFDGNLGIGRADLRVKIGVLGRCKKSLISKGVSYHALTDVVFRHLEPR